MCPALHSRTRQGARRLPVRQCRHPRLTHQRPPAIDSPHERDYVTYGVLPSPLQIALADAAPAGSGAEAQLSATVQRIVAETQPEEATYTAFHERHLQHRAAAIRELSPG